ncbi:MAG: hypothetical protein Sv326_0229 [Candidatus Fermentimicrarchaeum limneticum]|uniref:Uncharacterized protein n=1 Tax=Fermentimicrarchaeum limneticum TaxID=2795018 RepID=A0A7D6BUJ6_FERL1|nr:MAG: hypothetical protein Sv326_0229 [Candidatus Fermentimicrarchaeum limneticum]
MKRAQTAVEFLTTYAWVISGIILLVGALYYFGIFDILVPTLNQCISEPNMPCSSYKFEKFSNGTGESMRLAVRLSNTYVLPIPGGTCSGCSPCS